MNGDFFPTFLSDSMNYINTLEQSIYKSFGGGRYYYAKKRRQKILYHLKNEWLPNPLNKSKKIKF